MALKKIFHGLFEIFLQFSFGAVDGLWIRMPDKVFWLLISESGGDISLTIHIDELGLPFCRTCKLFLNEIFQIIASKIGLNIFSNGGENLVDFAKNIRIVLALRDESGENFFLITATFAITTSPTDRDTFPSN